MEDLHEQLRLTGENVNTKDAEIQAIKEDRAANAKVLKQTVKKADVLQKRVVSMTELNTKSENERAALRADCENAESLRERVLALCRAMGLDSVAPLSMQMVDLLEANVLTVLSLKDRQSLPGSTTNPETQIATTQGTQLPDLQPDNARRSRRKVTRHTSTENRNIRDAQTPIGPGSEREVSVVETRHRETTVEVTSVTHRSSSRGTGTVLEPPMRPYDTDSTPAARVQQSRATGSFVPLWETEPDLEHVPTSPFTDLSSCLLEIPEQWASPVKEMEPAKQSTKPSAERFPSGKKPKVTSKDRVHAPTTPQKTIKSIINRDPSPEANPELETVDNGQSSRNTLPPFKTAYSPTPDFSSPSNDHISGHKNAPANITSSGRTLKGTVKKGILHDETEAKPAKPRSKTPTTLPLTDRGTSGTNNKPASSRLATRGILKNPIASTSKKRGLEGAEVQANEVTSVAKRPKGEVRATISSQTAKPLVSAAPKLSLPNSGRNTHQHPYSPSAKTSGTSGQRRKRSQTSKGDATVILASGKTLT